jgi:hypothetical protein
VNLRYMQQGRRTLIPRRLRIASAMETNEWYLWDSVA